MNKLIIPNGGMPLHGDDFRFIDNAAREAISGVFDAFEGDSRGDFIISGFGYELTGNVLTVESGYVYIDNEVLFFPGQVLNGVNNPNNVEIQLEVTYDPNGLDVFANSIAQNTYEVRRAKLVNGLSDGNPILTGKRWKTAIHDLLKTEQVLYTPLVFQNGWAANNLPNNLKVFKHFNRVYMEGFIQIGTLSDVSSTNVFQLPSFLAPVTAINFVGITANNDTGLCSVKIATDGQVKVRLFTGTQGSLLAINTSWSK